MNPLREAWRRLGTPDAISLPVLALTFVAGVIGNAVLNAGAMGTAPFIALLIVSISAMWLPLFGVRQVLLRDPRRSRPLLVVATLIGSLAVRALLLGVMFGVFAGPAHVKWINLFLGAILNTGLNFVVGASLVSALRERQREIAELKSVRRELVGIAVGLASDYAERNAETVARVRSTLVDALANLDSADAERSLAALQHTASDVVRPLAHELAVSLPAQERVETSEPTVVTWQESLDFAATGRPFRPLLTVALLAVEYMAAAIAYRPGAWWMAVLAPLTLCLLALGNLLLQPWLRGRSRSVRIPSVALVGIGIGVAVGLLTSAAIGRSSAAVAVAAGLGFFAAGFTLGVTLFTAIARDRDRVIGELKDSEHALERELVRWRQAQWFQQRALSRALHGPIQMAVVAAAIRLDDAMRGGAVTPAVIVQVRADLIDAFGELQHPEGSVALLDQGLDRIVGIWDGLCEITTEVDPAIDEAATQDPVLRSLLIDIASEAVSNAVRHGRATHAAITITLDGAADVAHLAVATNSALGVAEHLPGVILPGLGTRLLDDCTLTWDRTITPSGDRLEALLPLDGGSGNPSLR